VAHLRAAGLVTGIDAVRTPETPSRMNRETAMALTPGAPPGREDRRRTRRVLERALRRRPMY
jgi:hypothetical protein